MTEKTDAQSFSFKAETKQLLNILIHSLYKDQEVFLRELLSNASDALNRFHYEMLTNQNVLDPDVELNIRITADKDEGVLTIQDTGVGMTKDEIIGGGLAGLSSAITIKKIDKDIDVIVHEKHDKIGFNRDGRRCGEGY